MAEQVLIGATITANTKGAVESIGSLKKQLRDAQQDVQALSDKFGTTSDQAIKAAKKAAQLKDAIGDAKQLTDSYNPDAKFKALGSAVQGVVGGFTAFQGALGLVGIKSEDVEKTLLKVQSALALSQGLDQLLEAGNAFDILKAKAVKAFSGIKAAIGSLGIGLLVVAIGTIVAYWDDIKAAVSGVSVEQMKLTKESENNLKSEKEKLEALGGQDNILKLQGKSEKDILKLKIAQTDEVIKATEANINQQKIVINAQVEAEKRNKSILKGLLEFVTAPLQLLIDGVSQIAKVFGAEFEFDISKSIAGAVFDPEEVSTKGAETIKELDKQLGALKNQRAGFQLAIQDIDKKASDTISADKQKELEKETQRLKDLAEANKQADKDIRKAKQENYLASIKDENERAKKKLAIDLQNRILEIDALDVDESKKRELRLQAAISTQLQLDALDVENKNKQAEKDKQFKETEAKKLEDTLAIAKTRQDAIREATSTAEENELFDLQEKYAKKLALVKGNAEAEAALVKEYEDIKKNIRINAINTELGNYASAAGSISQLLGQTTAAGKAFAIAEATINTYKAASQVFAAPVPGVAPVSLGVKIATMVSAIASGLKTVKSIVGVKAKGVPAGSNPQVPSISSVVPMMPQMAQATLTQLDQGSINRLGSATNRSYVVESDITNSQERIRRINRAARLN